MEKVVKKMRADDKHQQIANQKAEIKTAKTEIELEAQLKTQEFKEMLKHLK